VNYGVVLFPGFQALDLFGPLDVLNLLAMRRPPMNLYLIAATLDPVSTKAPSGIMNSTHGSSNGNGGNATSTPPSPPPRSNFAESIVPTHTFADAARLPLDVLMVPGGLGTRAPPAALAPAVAFIADAYPRLQHLLGVCTGVGLVARAGVLAGRRATTNKRSWRAVTAAAPPGVRWVARARWVVDGNVWTSSGVSAGIDLTFAFVGHLHGETLAQELADVMEYDWHRDADWDPFAALNNVTDVMS
jgi:transcriptional regulator GlxA family with amidase domain